MMRLLLFMFFLFPVCAMAQIEVVNEGMICDSNSNILEIGKFNYLRFKNLPEDAVVSVSDGIIKPDVKIKGRYYIPGQKTMEGKSIILLVTSTSEINFRKTFKFYKFSNNIYGEGYIPIRFGDKSFTSPILTIKRDSAITNPQFFSTSEEFKIESISYAFFGKGIDGETFKINGSKLDNVAMKYLKSKNYNSIWIEIYARLRDGNCYVFNNLIIRLTD